MLGSLCAEQLMFTVKLIHALLHPHVPCSLSSSGSVIQGSGTEVQVTNATFYLY